MDPARKQYRTGLASALLCAVAWGLLPVYWKSLEALDPFVVMLYRVLLAFVFVLVVSLVMYTPAEIIQPLRKKGAARSFFFAGLLISVNWSIYIWAVTAGFIIQTSLGYYIEPLFVVLLGCIFFREALKPYTVIAIALAAAGVAVMILSFGQAPTIALSIAVTFAAYAGIKKTLQAPVLLALLYETGLMLPIIVPAIIYLELLGNGLVATADSRHMVMLSLSGGITALPLLLFAMAAKRIEIITLGLTEYITPSLSLLIGIFVYKELFDGTQLAGLVIIWVGLAVFTLGGLRESHSLLLRRTGR